jgi:hypothetical protein
VCNTHQAVGEIAKKFDVELFCKEYKSGMTPKKIASSHNLDYPLVWSVPYLIANENPNALAWG